jgi:hypothetical protein
MLDNLIDSKNYRVVFFNNNTARLSKKLSQFQNFLLIKLSMAKLADLRSNLSKEEKEEYEKFRSNPSSMTSSKDVRGNSKKDSSQKNNLVRDASPVSDNETTTKGQKTFHKKQKNFLYKKKIKTFQTFHFFK